jgi:hypothetical protein
MRLLILLFASFLIIGCQGEPAPPVGGPSRAESGPEAPPTIGAEAPPTVKESGRDAPPTAKKTDHAAPLKNPRRELANVTTPPEKPPVLEPKRPPYMQTPTLPMSPNAKPVKIKLTKGGSLVLPKGTREIKVDDQGAGKPVIRHYYLNHPMGRGLTVTEFPLRGRSCDTLINTRESAYEIGYAKKDDPELKERQLFHKGARCDLALSACYFSDTSRRSEKEVEKGARFHREATYLLCKDDVAISVAWKVPDGADVGTEIIDALSRVAGTFSTR